MKILDDYCQRIEQASTYAQEVIDSKESLERISQKKYSLIESIKRNAYFKVPFVGDFSAGKSTMLNTYFDLNKLLPTDITPETSVAYELWYSEGESMELWRDSKLIETYKVSDISSLSVKPGDMVKLYLNNQKIKTLNDRGIVVVDMPGIDSGIEEHTSAILNYIHQGTAFAVFTDIEQGTLKGSAVSFIEELKKYGIRTAIFVSKADKKPKQEQEKVLSTVTSIAKRIISDDVFVGLSSAFIPLTEDIDKWLGSLDAEELARNKFDKQVDAFIASIKNELALSLSLLKKDSINYEEQIKELTDRKEASLTELRRNAKASQSLDDSVKDVMMDVDYALKASASKLALLIYSSKDDSININAELMGIIRPAIINAFSRELAEYQDFLDDGVQNFSIDVDSLLEDVRQEDELLASSRELVGDILGDLLPLLDIPLPLAKIIAHKVAEYVPDVLKVFLGKNDSEAVSGIKTKLIQDMYPRILNELRPSIKDAMSKSREDLLTKAENQIEEEASKYDEILARVQTEMQADRKAREEKVTKIENSIAIISKL